MGMAQRCLFGKHRYEDAPGTGAGLLRKRCVNCGAVMIDLREDESHENIEDEDSENAARLFAPRRATLFSVSPEPEPAEYAFGRHRVRR
jgi:hypothetical protein